MADQTSAPPVNYEALGLRFQDEIRERFLPLCSKEEELHVTNSLIPLVKFGASTCYPSNHTLLRGKIPDDCPELLRWAVACFVFGLDKVMASPKYGGYVQSNRDQLARFQLQNGPCVPFPKQTARPRPVGVKRKAPGGQMSATGDDGCTENERRVKSKTPPAQTNLHNGEPVPVSEAGVSDRESAIQSREADLKRREDSLTSKETEMDERESLIRTREAELKSREDVLKSRKASLDNRAAALDSLKASLSDDEASLDDRKVSLGSGQMDLEICEADLHRCEAELQLRKAKLESRESELDNRDAAAVSRKADLDSLEIALSDRDTGLKSRKAELDNLEIDLDRRALHLGNQEIKLNNREAGLEERALHMGNRETNLSKHETDLNNLEASLEERALHLGSRTTDLNNLETALDNREAAAHARESQLENKDESNDESKEVDKEESKEESDEGKFSALVLRSLCFDQGRMEDYQKCFNRSILDINDLRVVADTVASSMQDQFPSELAGEISRVADSLTCATNRSWRIFQSLARK